MVSEYMRKKIAFLLEVMFLDCLPHCCCVCAQTRFEITLLCRRQLHAMFHSFRFFLKSGRNMTKKKSGCDTFRLVLKA